MKERVILHCDLNNFYASVEIKDNPALFGKPLVVAGDPKKRHGVVLAKNDLAKSYGIKTGEPLISALGKAPGLISVPPRFERYTEESEHAFKIYQDYTSRVEPFGADECWLDCTGSTRLFGSGETIAHTVRERIKRERGLTISVGVSFNKIFAKLGSDLKKPDAVTVIGSDNFKTVVWPLAAGELFMVGRKTAEKLRRLGIYTIGQLAAAEDALLSAHFGINGIKMKRNALGLDDEPVREADDLRPAESVGHGMTAAKQIATYQDADALYYFLADKVAVRLRKSGLTAGGVHIGVRDERLTYRSKQAALPAQICSAAEIASTASRLLREMWKESDTPLRTLTVSCYALESSAAPRQLSLFSDSGTESKDTRLEQAMDAIRSKYGKAAIARADLIERDFIYDKSDDEDFLPFRR